MQARHELRAQENKTPRKLPRDPDPSTSTAASASDNMATADSRPSTASLPVRPVTARTWQALITGDARKQVSLYTNDLFGQLPATDASPADLASPRYQPASARTASQHAGKWLHQQTAANAGSTGALGSSDRSPSRPAISSQVLTAAGPSTAGQAAGTSIGVGPVAPSSAVRTPTDGKRATGSIVSSRTAQPTTSGATEQRPSTAPISRPFLLRTSAVSLSSLRPDSDSTMTSHIQRTASHGPAVRPVIAMDSPRLQQLLGHNFASAVSAGSTLSGPSSGAHAGGSSLRQQWQQPRPGTPTFQRLATSLTCPVTAADSGAPAGSADFSIAASLTTRLGPQSTPQDKLAGDYPAPPATAPAKAALVVSGVSTILQPQQGQSETKTAFAMFGINPASFIAAGKRATGAQAGTMLVPPPQPPQLAQLLASAALASQAGLRSFLLAPGPADRPMQCRIFRSKGGLLKGGTQYKLVLEEAQGGGRFLLAARTRAAPGGGARFTISCEQHDPSRHGSGYCGKLRCNFLGTEFVACEAGASAVSRDGRRELVAVTYQTNVLGTKGPRKMTAIIPKLAPEGAAPLLVVPSKESETLLGQYRQYALADSIVLRNKPPRWNEALGAYCLSFGGRVTQASVKNFQLVAVDNMERVVLQFGKVSSEAWTMDYAYPMTAMQAFSICLSSFASKLACE